MSRTAGRQTSGLPPANHQNPLLGELQRERSESAVRRAAQAIVTGSYDNGLRAARSSASRVSHQRETDMPMGGGPALTHRS